MGQGDAVLGSNVVEMAVKKRKAATRVDFKRRREEKEAAFLGDSRPPDLPLATRLRWWHQIKSKWPFLRSVFVC
jgi:hypothetical protein